MTTESKAPQANAYPNVAAGFLLRQAEDEARESDRWPWASIDLDSGSFLHVVFFAGGAGHFEYGYFDASAEVKRLRSISRDEAIDVLARCIEAGAS